MSDGLPKSEYDVNYLQIIIFVIIFISLLLLSFFAGYYAGKKSAVKTGNNQKKEEIFKSEQKKKSVEPSKLKKAVIKKQPEITKKNKQEKEVKPKEITPVKTLSPKKQEKIGKKEVQTKKRVYRKGYYIQVAAFKDLNSAKKKVKKYRRKFKVIIYYPTKDDKRKWYRLWIGPYSDKTKVKNALIRLKKEFGIKGFIRKLD